MAVFKCTKKQRALEKYRLSANSAFYWLGPLDFFVMRVRGAAQ